jgi:hypothetical protein
VAYQSNETGRWEVYISAFPEPRGATRISTRGGQYPQWGAGGRELLYVSLDNKLMAVSLKMGADTVEPSTPRELFPLPAVDTGLSPYDTTPDGQRFLVRATPGQAAQPLTVIVNWPALLKREAPAPRPLRRSLLFRSPQQEHRNNDKFGHSENSTTATEYPPSRTTSCFSVAEDGG